MDRSEAPIEPPNDLSWGAQVLLRGVLWVWAFGLRIVDFAVLLVRPRLLKPYMALLWARFRWSPYRWPSDFETTLGRKRTGQSLRELMYGDTPVSVLVYLLGRAGLRSTGRLLDIGAGRGHGLLAAAWWGAEGHGVELVAHHVRIAAPHLQSIGLQLEEGAAGADVLPLNDVTHVYLAWTGFSEEIRQKIGQELLRLPPGARVVVLTHPLQNSGFDLQRQGIVPLPWGVGDFRMYKRGS